MPNMFPCAICKTQVAFEDTMVLCKIRMCYPCNRTDWARPKEVKTLTPTCDHGQKSMNSCIVCTPKYLRKVVNTRINAAGIRNADNAAILGCTIEDFKVHMESKMKPGMTWENYGRGDDKWCIDYITPLGYETSSKVKDKEIIKHRLHYLNTQPMWCTQQWKKGNRYIG